MTTHQEILKLIEDIENNDDNIKCLEKAMESYCGNYDMIEGFKHALTLTINDQYNNHPEDQDEDKEMSELKSILTKNN